MVFKPSIVFFIDGVEVSNEEWNSAEVHPVELSEVEEDVEEDVEEVEEEKEN